MTDQQIERIVREAEKGVGTTSFAGARVVTFFTAIATSCVFLGGALAAMAAIFSFVGWMVAISLWSDGRKFKTDLKDSKARTIWEEIYQSGALGTKHTEKERELLANIRKIYGGDPQGQVMPLQQALRLFFAWKKQQERLGIMEEHIEQLLSSRAALLEKDRLLRQLNDTSSSVERAITQLNDDIAPLVRSCDILRASCARLEALLIEIDATVRRRQLHREVGEITAQLPAGPSATSGHLSLSDEHLDLERQIGREIETFLQLERDTEVHLRGL